MIQRHITLRSDLRNGSGEAPLIDPKQPPDQVHDSRNDCGKEVDSTPRVELMIETMNAKKLTQIPIGRFSKMTRLSIKALRLYNEQGLLHPAYVDESTGYRYYHQAQAKRAEIIRILRLVEMPLDDIQAILESDDDETISRQLLIHKARLTEKLAAQEHMLDYLESIIQRKEMIMPYEVNVLQQKSQLVATVKFHTTLSKIPTDIAAGFGTLVRGLGHAGVTPTGMPMILYHNVIDQESEGDVEIAIPIEKSFTGDGDVVGRELEGGAMASVVHRGRYTEIALAYHSLTQWISENGHGIAGPTREIYLNDPQIVPEADLLTRLEFPICAAGDGEE